MSLNAEFEMSVSSVLIEYSVNAEIKSKNLI